MPPKKGNQILSSQYETGRRKEKPPPPPPHPLPPPTAPPRSHPNTRERKVLTKQKMIKCRPMYTVQTLTDLWGIENLRSCLSGCILCTIPAPPPPPQPVCVSWHPLSLSPHHPPPPPLLSLGTPPLSQAAPPLLSLKRPSLLPPSLLNSHLGSYVFQLSNIRHPFFTESRWMLILMTYDSAERLLIWWPKLLYKTML